MFPTTTVLSLSLLALLTPTIVLADYAFSTTLPIGSLPDSQKNDWCTSHVETCEQICNKGTTDKDGKEVDNQGVKLNTCVYTTLQYQCYCNRQNDQGLYRIPMMEYFHYSVPGLMCQASWDLCKQNFKDDEDMKKQCDEQIGKKCGKKYTKQQITKERKLAKWFGNKFGKREGKKREVTFEA